MRELRRTVVTLAACVLLSPIAAAQTPGENGVTVPPEWAASYTPEEIAAIQKTLWAGNFTLEDLRFNKDYAKGYQCLPDVYRMLRDPMEIAPFIDSTVAGFAEWKETLPSPVAEVVQSMTCFPGGEEAVSDIADLYGEGLAEFRKVFGETRSWDEAALELQAIASRELEWPFTQDELDLLRQYLPMNMAWHDVFESPYSQEQISVWDEDLKAQPADYLYALASRTSIVALSRAYIRLCPAPNTVLTGIPSDKWPVRPFIFEKDGLRIGIGTPGDDEWEGDFAVLIDPGGNDHYKKCRIGAAYGTDGHRFGYFADLGGNDFYDCGDVNITCGAAILGIAAFYDLGEGNDRYVVGSCALGAAMGGTATFYDDGGSDIYEAKVYTQGAAGFGIGVMVDDSVSPAPVFATDVETPDPIDITVFDNDSLSAWTNSQAFARTLGVAICSNRRGNDVYYAGGVYLHAPLFADRYQSFSQGFAIGERGIDYAGGIALILDYAGNDRYLGDIYNQGVGYWYSAGLMYDGAGNDMYEMTQYGQGSGIHLAVGGLVDVSGNDAYMMHAGLGTGGSHDFATSVLHDRGGNDQYFGNTSCNGGSLTNSAVVFIDRAGDDTYAGRREGGINFGRPERGFISIGVLVDLGGNDDYLGIMDNGVMWSHTSVGVGWDVIPPPSEQQAAEAPPERGQLGENVPIPEIINYEGELTQEVFTELWDIATRWAVGDNRYIVPKAIDRLIAFGPPVLPYLSNEFKDDRGGLAIDPFNRILKAISEQDRDGVLAVLRENVTSDDPIRLRVAMSIISELKTMELEGEIAALLDNPDLVIQRRAIGVLGALGSHAADDRLLSNLDPSKPEALIKVSMETLFKLQMADYEQIRPLLEYPTITVREALIGRLIENASAYVEQLRTELRNAAYPGAQGALPPLSVRSLRSVLKVWAGAPLEPAQADIDAISVLLHHPDWGVRADAVRVAQHWRDYADLVLASHGDPSHALELEALVEPLLAEIQRMLRNETEPFVLFVGGKKD